jgi:hypothetical protein
VVDPTVVHFRLIHCSVTTNVLKVPLPGRCELSWEISRLYRRNGRFKVITMVLLKLPVCCGVTMCIV